VTGLQDPVRDGCLVSVSASGENVELDVVADVDRVVAGPVQLVDHGDLPDGAGARPG
jgi:hypothetical protein